MLAQQCHAGIVQAVTCSAAGPFSYYTRRVQVKDVIDGDLCEQFSQLPAQKQKQIAEDLERSPGEVLKKLEDLRNQIY